MSQLCSNYLHLDWEDHVHNEILNSCLDPNQESFWVWSQYVINLNCLLRNTTSVFDNTTLCNQLNAHLDDGLKECVKHSEAKKEKTLKSWIDVVHQLDETRTSKNKCHRELIEETFNKCQAKRQNTDSNTFCNPSRQNNTSNSNANSSTSTFTPLPLLLDSECTLLDGCTKCRKFYVSHRSQDCPTGFPSGKGYKTLSITDTLTAKKGKSTATSSSSNKQAPKAVAAMAPLSDDKPNIIAAVLPSTSDYKSDSDSDENADISKRDVSTSIKAKHLLWDCQIHGLLTDFPVKTQGLIDNGAHLVLIHPDLITKLNLRKYHLHKPEIIDVTMNDEQKTPSELYDYVKLSLTSLDAIWTSKSVKALITLNLCMPVILRLPFLIHNMIVTNHAARTCIDKTLNYDLLNPLPVFPPPPPKPRLCEQLAETKADKKLMLAELMMVCHDCLKNQKFQPHITEDFNVAGAIRDRIEILATKESLAKQDTAIRSEFKEVFEPILHVDQLPTNVCASIKLKDTEKTIKSRSYPSPWKYKEAWSILIQQHLDAGRI